MLSKNLLIIFETVCVILCSPVLQTQTLTGFSYDSPLVSKTTGFSYVGDGNRLADAIVSNALGPRLRTTRRVSLEQHAITTREIEAISSLPLVEHLTLGTFPDFVEMDSDCIHALAKMKSLQSLEIYAKIPDTVSWKPIGALTELRELEIGGDFDLNEADCETIGKLPHLEHLAIDSQIACENFGWLRSLKRLKSLRIHADDIDPSIFGALKQLPSLDSLGLYKRTLQAKPNENN